ncbi:alpha/beta hydrolase [Knoellia locipacati]|uniref:alpha/beta fold hydrolase n=1 Tax=Knoellia locipacati TaxID=882824 RepID=UPI00384A9883
MRLTLGDISVYYDVSGPGLVADGSHMAERPTVVTVHGGPGIDHVSMRTILADLTDHLQLVYYDQRGHGRTDHAGPETWNLRTWATDLKLLCDALGLVKPIVLGISFGGFVAAAYAGLFPEHPGGVILANTTGGRLDVGASIETFRRLGGDEVAEVARRDFDELTEESAAEFDRVCLPLFSWRPGFAEELAASMGQSTMTVDVNLHFNRAQQAGVELDPWSLFDRVTCPVLVLAGSDDPICTIDVVEDMVDALSATDVRLLRVEGARHAVFRDAPTETVTAVREFAAQVAARR